MTNMYTYIYMYILYSDNVCTYKHVHICCISIYVLIMHFILIYVHIYIHIFILIKEVLMYVFDSQIESDRYYRYIHSVLFLDIDK